MDSNEAFDVRLETKLKTQWNRKKTWAVIRESNPVNPELMRLTKRPQTQQTQAASIAYMSPKYPKHAENE